MKKASYFFSRIIFVFLLCKLDVLCVSDTRLVQGTNANVGEAWVFLREYDTEASEMCFRVNMARWNYATNMTDNNKRRMVEEQMHKAKFDKVSWKKAVLFDWTGLKDSAARRHLKLLVTKGRASLTDEKFNEIYHLISEMRDEYNHVKICPYNTYDPKFCNLELDPDIMRLTAHSRNPMELLHIWTEWHDKTGPPLKNKFMRYVQLSNQAARMTGFSDAGEQMRYVYEDNDFGHELVETWRSLEDLYKELFTYARHKLVVKYGPEFVRADGPIPAHLLGDVWAQDWSGIADILLPYPTAKSLDVTDDMMRQGFTPLRMFQMAEEFYTSLGLKSMPPEFWRHSLFEKPTDRKIQCTASAWDFCNRIDYRIKQCTDINMENLITAHHEMAHIQYYLQYSEQPFLYRDGANPGFHEGFANAISLSVFNPSHLHRIGLFNNSTDTFETNTNYLMKMALQKVAYAPFAYLVDQWRYRVFRDGVNNMNAAWWDLRLRYQGVVPPIRRKEQHLDAAAKKHIPADLPYINYYVALLLEFQIYEALCKAAGHTGQLHTCDIYRSREAGRLLSEALQVGKARHWKDVIRMLTKGQTDRISADAMLKYFQPLLLWLRVQNREEPVIGWNSNDEDTMLFQPLISCSSFTSANKIILIVSLMGKIFQ